MAKARTSSRHKLSIQATHSRIAKATGIAYRDVQRLYKGRPDAAAKALRAKSISRSVSSFRRAKEIRDYREDSGADYRTALTWWKLERRISRTRLWTHYYRSGDPRIFTQAIYEKYGERVTRGPEAGSIRVYVDTLADRPLGRADFERLRRDIWHERIAFAMTDQAWGQYRRWHKFYDKATLARIRKRKPARPTLAEARRVASKIARWAREKHANYLYLRQRIYEAGQKKAPPRF